MTRRKLIEATKGRGARAQFLRGAFLAADVASTYNGVSDHPYDLGDCVLGKLGLLDKRCLRKNRRRAPAPTAGVQPEGGVR